MKSQLVAVYKRESTLWKNANGFYHATDWTRMECVVVDYTEEIESCRSQEIKWIDINGKDVTEREIERRYGKPYEVRLINKRKTNSHCYSFKTKEEANQFVISVLNDRILKNFKKVSDNTK